MADRRIAVEVPAGRTRGRAPAVADRAVALPWQRAGMLGSGGSRCDGSCISGCRFGRSTGGTCPSAKIPARRLKKPRSRPLPMPPDDGFSPRSIRPRLQPVAPGMPLADALAFLTSLATAAAEPAEDAAALRRLAEWCSRYSPWTAPDGTDGVRVEITGSAHLWGGET